MQVVGRVHGEASMRVVERLNTTAVGLNDEPVQAMRVSDCGPTDSQVAAGCRYFQCQTHIAMPKSQCGVIGGGVGGQGAGHGMSLLYYCTETLKS